MWAAAGAEWATPAVTELPAAASADAEAPAFSREAAPAPDSRPPESASALPAPLPPPDPRLAWQPLLSALLAPNDSPKALRRARTGLLLATGCCCVQVQLWLGVAVAALPWCTAA